MEISEHLREQIESSHQFSKKNDCRQDSGPKAQEFAEKEELLTPPRRRLISSFEITNGTINAPLLLF